MEPFIVALIAALLHGENTEGSPDPVPVPGPFPGPVPLLDPPETDDNNGLFFIYSHWPTKGPSDWSDEARTEEDDDDHQYYRKIKNKRRWHDDYDDDDYYEDDDDEEDNQRKRNRHIYKRNSKEDWQNDRKYGEKDSSEENPRDKERSMTSTEDFENRWTDDEAHFATTHGPLTLSDDVGCWESGEGRPSNFGSLTGKLLAGEGCAMNCDSNLYDPVCGGNGNTYNNKCFLDEAICFYPEEDLEMIIPYACPDKIEQRLCEFKRCGEEAKCRKSLGVCQCNDGFVGNPKLGCTPGGKCAGVACGENAKCDGNTGRCKCFKDYSGNPEDHCEHINACEHVKCVNNAYCYKGKCLCRPGFEGDPKIMCTKISITSTVEITIELSQAFNKATHPELTQTLNTMFCDDLLTTTWKDKCDTQRGINSPFAKYKNCQNLGHPVKGECQVIKFSKGRSETTVVRMIVKYDSKQILEEKHDFMKNQLKNLPGLREPMTGEVIWYSRRPGPDHIHVMPIIFKMSSVTVGCKDDSKTYSKVEEHEQCKDLLSPHRCEGIKAAFSCASEPAEQYCPKHCGICPYQKVDSKKYCFDMYTRSECAKLKSSNKCSITEVKLVCEETCNQCTLQLHKECTDLGTSSLCFHITHVWGCLNNHIPKRFKYMCRKSCGLC